MSGTTASTPGPGGREPLARPTAFRRIAGFYLDILFSAFLAWIACYALGWPERWDQAALVLLCVELFWCQDRLRPTVGELCLGIRYLTSSSAHVVADIKVVNPKSKLNHPILLAGVIDITLCFLFLSGWTFLNRVALFGWTIDPPASLAYWFLGGMLFFTSGACLLGGSRSTVWVVPAVHLFFCADWLRGEGTWQALLQTAVEGSPRLAEALAAWEKAPGPGFPELFCLVSLFQLGVVAFSRRHWTH